MDLRSTTRCKKCKMQEKLCICVEIPQLETSTRLTLVIHSREAPKPTNSGLLATSCLRNSAVHVRGRIDEKVDAEMFCPAGYESVVLFPSPDAMVLTPEVVGSKSLPLNLIVPDGNWKQATRIPKRMPELRELERVILPLGDPSEYRLRHEPRKPHGLATMEAIARAMRIVEGEAVYEAMMHVFRLMVERTLYTKGKVVLGDIYGGIPQQSDP